MSLPRGLKTLMLALKIQFPSAWWLMRDLDPELYQCSYKAEHLLQRKAIHQTKKKKKNHLLSNFVLQAGMEQSSF